jgi:hypothetical protein
MTGTGSSPTSGNNSYIYSGNLLRLDFSQNRDSGDWNEEFAVPFLLGMKGKDGRFGYLELMYRF